MDPSPSSSSSSPAIEPNSRVGAASAAGGSRRRRRRSGGGPPPPPPSAAAAKEGNGVVWDAAYGNELTDEAPEQEPKRGYFRRARISVLALMKMTLDALSGGLDRKAGYLQGGVVGDAIVVMDSFHVPGFGIEAETESCEEYFHAYTSSAAQAGRFDVLVGWYHSHPGYGCWLSAADVSAQSFFQTHRKQSVAIVIDPMRTVSAGKVEIGAYRTYPHMPPDETVFKYQTIPLDMIGEYTVTRKHYYALGITYFMSSLDSHLLNLLRNKYWVNSFFSSSLLANWDCAAEQVSDLAEKLEVAEDQMDHTFLESSWPEKEQEESQLAMIARDSKKIAEEQVHRLILQARKNELFNTFHQLNETMRSLAD